MYGPAEKDAYLFNSLFITLEAVKRGDLTYQQGHIFKLLPGVQSSEEVLRISWRQNC